MAFFRLGRATSAATSRGRPFHSHGGAPSSSSYLDAALALCRGRRRGLHHHRHAGHARHGQERKPHDIPESGRAVSTRAAPGVRPGHDGDPRSYPTNRGFDRLKQLKHGGRTCALHSVGSAHWSTKGGGGGARGGGGGIIVAAGSSRTDTLNGSPAA